MLPPLRCEPRILNSYFLILNFSAAVSPPVPRQSVDRIPWARSRRTARSPAAPRLTGRGRAGRGGRRTALLDSPAGWRAPRGRTPALGPVGVRAGSRFPADSAPLRIADFARALPQGAFAQRSPCRLGVRSPRGCNTAPVGRARRQSPGRTLGARRRGRRGALR